MSTHDDLDFLDDDNAAADTHDLAQDYLAAKQSGGASRWVVPLLLILGVGAAGGGAWVFYLRDMLFPVTTITADSAMGVPTNTITPTAPDNTLAAPNDTGLPPAVTAPPEIANAAPNVAQDIDQNAAMGLPPATTATPTVGTPSSTGADSVAAPLAPALPAPAIETDANFAPPLTTEKAEATSVDTAKTEATAQPIAPEPTNTKPENTPNTVTSEELVTPAMPTPTALPTDEVKPLAEKTPTETPVAEDMPPIPATNLADTATDTTTKNKEEPTAQQAEILLLRDQMRALTEAVDKVKTTPPATNAPANADQFAAKEAVDKLNQQLTDLTTKLDTINQRTESLMQTAQNKQNNAVETTTPVTPEVTTNPVAEAAPKIVAKPKPKSVPKPVARVIAKKPVMPVVRKATWQLRSASPGVAGLAKNGGSEIQTFVVGDTVPGFGRVTAVQQDTSGQWVVLTTGGTLHQ